MKTDILTVPTVTLALKAKKALSKQGINATVLKLDSYRNQNGCSFGIEFPSSEFYSVVRIMKELDIEFKHLQKDTKK